MKVRRLNIVNSYLQDLLKSVWILEDSSSCAGHVLLPVKEVDLMVNLSGTINHSEADSVIERGHIFSNVIRNTPVEISHNGELSVLGMSFNSFSLPALIVRTCQVLKHRIRKVLRKVFPDFCFLNPQP